MREWIVEKRGEAMIAGRVRQYAMVVFRAKSHDEALAAAIRMNEDALINARSDTDLPVRYTFRHALAAPKYDVKQVTILSATEIAEARNRRKS